MRQSFLLYIDALDFMDELEDQEVGNVFRAIRSHMKGEEYTLTKLEKIAFLPIKNSLDRDNDKYENIVEKRKSAGSMGGKQRVANQANASKSKQNQANQAVPVTVSVSDTVPVSVSVSENTINTGLLEKVIKIINVREKPTKARVKQLKARQSEGYSDHEIIETAKVLAASKWHRENGQMSVDNLLAPTKFGKLYAKIEQDEPVNQAVLDREAEIDRLLNS